MEKYKLGLVSLGCDKNRVDSEIMLGMLKNTYEITEEPKEADIIIVNTCGFIESSKQESIDTILEMAEYKKDYNCKLLMATGCLTQRYGEELLKLMPELDIILGVNNYGFLDQYVEKFIKTRERIMAVDYLDSGINEGERILTTGFGQTAYLRISEGCSNHCTYCIIPKIRGTYRSRPMEKILEEAKTLAKGGVQEVIVVAQDTTRYGTDLYGKKALPELLRRLKEIEGIKWIRVLYLYPEEFTEELIEELKTNEKVVKYLDLPIQHISDGVLKRMARRTKKEDLLSLLRTLRHEIPDLVLRTSLIVGFPGETDEEFKELYDFVDEIEFDKLGVFTYSKEEGTAAALMKEQIRKDVKERRRNLIMERQQEVSRRILERKVGKTYEVLVEGMGEDGYYGRNFEMAPEVDGMIIIKTQKDLMVGSFVDVKIIEALEYDLVGVLL
ncbi:30S ribosomal protein S12 methylthiotransferase RimO [Proteiniclasticum ruminis]|uniref:Ribosomal protein uS12 methylthiotransferase RimO n=1 Tax=Proteiniclasticum ruminis TaxID=398199 RepID=A0A1I5AMG1_9CLOT|nr:30S ribosomal protein S12 methylthiotransferase RimO [Proteiniclasticum ruminis]SFN63605.1 SSU ribosomal protein S12P methylthiotransferase [Proteiniclasticum ruminis]